MRRLVSWCVLGLWLPGLCFPRQGLAQETAMPETRFDARVFMSPAGGELPYRLLKPKTVVAGQKYPLVVFLHGAGERGVDNVVQLVHGMTDISTEAMQLRHPAYVIAPQCPADQQWVNTPWTADSHTMPEQPTAPLRQVLELITALEQEFPIDNGRIYATGLSMGGFGAWDLVQRHPERFAGALIVCGGGDAALAPRLKSVPIWAFHGDKDSVVKVRRSRDMIAAIQAAGGRPIYTEYEGVEHNSWAPTFANRAVWDWLFSQSR